MAAAVAVRILNGEKAGDIKTPPDHIRIPEIRLAANAALGDQRERPSAGEHDLLQATHAMGNSTAGRSSQSLRCDTAASALILGLLLWNTAAAAGWRSKGGSGWRSWRI